MRNNLPITQKAIAVKPGAAIISHTDASGRITYANEDFFCYSGYSRDELIGQSHNIVRHPDMPSMLFADLWRTLKEGKAW